MGRGVWRSHEHLESSLRKVRSGAERDPHAMLAAAEFLVACGRFEEAEIGLQRSEALLQRQRVGFSSLESLRSVNRRLNGAGVTAKIRRLGDTGARLFAASEEAILCAVPRSRKLLVVFASMYGDFWISLPVLHCLLPSESTTVLYLKDPANMMFLCGLKHFGPGFDALCAGIRAVAAERAIDDIRVMGFSSGGFGGLLAATRVGASAYLGLSVRTDLDPRSALANDRYASRDGLRAAAPDLMVDLKPVLEKSAFPRLGVLYYGARNRIDAAHARHLEGVRNFKVNGLPDARHNTVMSLLAEGRFDAVIRKFVG